MNVIHHNQINPEKALAHTLLAQTSPTFDKHLIGLFKAAHYLDIKPLFVVIKNYLSLQSAMEYRQQKTTRFQRLIEQLPEDLQREVTAHLIQQNLIVPDKIKSKYYCINSLLASEKYCVLNFNNISHGSTYALIAKQEHQPYTPPLLHCGSLESCFEELKNANEQMIRGSLVWSPDDKFVLFYGSWEYKDILHMWDSKTKALLGTRKLPETLLCVCWSHDNRSIIAGFSDGTIRIYDAQSHACLHTLKGHGDNVLSVAISKDGKTLLSASRDSLILIWKYDAEQNTYSYTHVLDGHYKAAEWVIFSPDERSIFSTGADFSIRKWDALTGLCEKVYSGLQGASQLVSSFKEIFSFQLSPDGTKIMASSFGGIMVWDVFTGNIESRIESTYGNTETAHFFSNERLGIKDNVTSTQLHTKLFPPDELFKLSLNEIKELEKLCSKKNYHEFSEEEHKFIASLPSCWHKIFYPVEEDEEDLLQL